MTIWQLVHLYLTHRAFFATHPMLLQLLVEAIRHLL